MKILPFERDGLFYQNSNAKKARALLSDEKWEMMDGAKKEATVATRYITPIAMAPRESATTSLQARYGKWERQSSVWCWILWVTGRESVLPKKTSAIPMLMWSAFLSSEIWRGCCEEWNDCIWNETNHVANKSASVLSLLNPNDRITSFWCIIETLFPFVLFILSFLIIHSIDPLSLNNLPSSPWTPPFFLFLLNASPPPPLSKTILLSLIASVFVVPRGFQLNASLHSSRGLISWLLMSVGNAKKRAQNIGQR